MRRSRVPVLSAAVGVFWLLSAGAAQAQFPGDVPNTFRLAAGGMYAWFNTEVTFEQNSTDPIGDGINFEDVFNLPSRPGFFGRASFNFGFLSL